MRNVILIFVLSMVLNACDFAFEGSTLKKGMAAPILKTKTLADVDGDFSRITTYRQPDKRMYQYSLDDAMRTGKLILLEFATPGHCTVCDKQLQMLKAIINKFEDDVLVLHMDQYQNTKAFIEYKIQGDPWTFLIDKKGIVQFKRPGRMLYQEMELAILSVLENQSQG